MAVETPTWFSSRRIEVGLTITIPPSATGHLVLCLGWSGDEKMIEHGDVDDDSCFRYCKSISITLYVYSMWMCTYIYIYDVDMSHVPKRNGWWSYCPPLDQLLLMLRHFFEPGGCCFMAGTARESSGEGTVGQWVSGTLCKWNFPESWGYL